MDVCTDSMGPALINKFETYRKALVELVMRDTRIRFVTEITKVNIEDIKELAKISNDVRHLDGCKGNFAISEAEYLSIIVHNDYLVHKLVYAIEFRHPSWKTEGPWEMLKHYNIAAVITDSPAKENLQFLSDIVITADHSLVRFHGRNIKGHYWYNYLYSRHELEPWVDKINEIRNQTKVLRIYFNNHYGGNAVVNALQFKEMATGTNLFKSEQEVLRHAEKYIAEQKQ